jgi:hypothetical protein
MRPPQRFSETGSKSRMIQVWLILIAQAHVGEPITYSELSVLMLGKRLPRSPAMRLGQLLTYCKERGLPPLPVIVVTKKTKKPAPDAPYNPSAVPSDMRRVFAFDWFGIHPPTEDDLED